MHSLDHPPIRREHLGLPEDVAYLNTARHGPLPRCAVDAAHAFLAEAAEQASNAWMRWDQRHTELRRLGADLQGAATVDDVCLISSTTQLLSAVAHGLRLGEGDRVVVRATDFPSTRLVWQSLAADGVEVDLLDDRTTWEDALARPASAVCAQWVRTDTGERQDLEVLARLTHDAGGVLVVDAIQGLGVVPAQFAAWGVDAAGAGSFKWLLGPEGTGFGYLSPGLRARLRPIQPGWYSDWRGAAGADGLLPALAFTEGGAPNSMGNAALHASASLLLEAGIARVWGHVDAWTRELVAQVGDRGEVASPQGEGVRSGIVTVRGDPALVGVLAGANVVVSPSGHGVRISPHGFSTGEDLQRLLAAWPT